jgi:hypothetical protein
MSRVVECKNCKYSKFDFTPLSNSWRWCESKGAQQHYNQSAIEQHSINKNGDCLFYKKQWWRWWVKTEISIGAFSISDLEELRKYLIDTHPEILMEFYLFRNN